MMSNSEIYFFPGKITTDFVLSILNMNVNSVNSDVYWIMSFFLALYFWSVVVRISIAAIKKATGFERRGRY